MNIYSFIYVYLLAHIYMFQIYIYKYYNKSQASFLVYIYWLKENLLYIYIYINDKKDFNVTCHILPNRKNYQILLLYIIAYCEHKQELEKENQNIVPIC